jgi:isoquinoline 1-oxidoreductase beta subunit
MPNDLSPLNPTMSRRGVLAGAGGLTVGFYVGGTTFIEKALGALPAPGQVNAFVQISPDGIVTVISPKTEMGQGTHTGVAVLVAEELGVDWQDVRVEHAPSLPQYRAEGFPGSPPAQVTGGSSSISRGFDAFRQAGAIARDMLRQAAANKWGVDMAEVTAANGALAHVSGTSATYGEMADAAGKLTPPESAAVKDPSEWTLIGTSPQRVDTASKTDGSAVYGIDIQIDTMLIGTVRQAPVFGGTLRGVDPAPALSVKGVAQVVPLDNAVVVLADSYWTALKGLEKLAPDWDLGVNVAESDSTIETELDRGIAGQNEVGVNTGDVDAAFAGAAKIVEADYEVPYLSHSPMEPMNATVWAKDGTAEVWAPVQVQTRTQQVVAEALGLKPDDVMVYTPQLGGGFGRRLQPDFAAQAALASKAAGRPVKLVWSREEDTRHSYYRPRAKIKFRGAVDGSGKPTAMDVVMAEDSAVAGFGRGNPRMKAMVGRFASGWLTGEAYNVPNARFSYYHPELLVPIGAWRSVQFSHNGFFGESMIDELAHAAGQDPMAFRRAQAANPRYTAVLDKVAEMSGWGRNLPKGHGLGVAMVESFGSIVGEVMEVSVDGKDIRAHNVWCAIDCGLAVHPKSVMAQMESAITYGLSAAYYGEINIEDGRVVQSNFDGYDMVRIGQAPEIEVEVINSGAEMGGAGEPGLPPIAAALTNAIYAASGTRIRKLPLIKSGYYFV